MSILDYPVDEWPRREAVSHLVALLCRVPAGRRAALMKAAAAYCPPPAWSAIFPVSGVRVAFAVCWKRHFEEPVPVRALREFLTGPVSVQTQVHLGRLNVLEDVPAIERAVHQLIQHLHDAVSGPQKPSDASRPPPDALPHRR